MLVASTASDLVWGLLVATVLWWVVFGYVGLLVANHFGLPRWVGVVLAVAFGPIGLVIVWVMGEVRVRANGRPDRRLVVLDAEIPETQSVEQPRWVPPSF